MKKLAAFLLVIGLAAGLYAQDASDFEVELTKDGNGVIIKNYIGAVKDVVIPDTIDGVPVTEIAKAAFFRKRYITSVTLPVGISKIGATAFSFCNALVTVTVPDSVTKAIDFGLGVFQGCTKLTIASQTALKDRGYKGGF
ncbi:hypothetical protein AGMMS50230_11760 [Spirochaetia bacterium]|nr:hypothetical protein AGMMS50230_11760 [Spirochaetia bacterium]